MTHGIGVDEPQRAWGARRDERMDEDKDDGAQELHHSPHPPSSYSSPSLILCGPIQRTMSTRRPPPTPCILRVDPRPFLVRRGRERTSLYAVAC